MGNGRIGHATSFVLSMLVAWTLGGCVATWDTSKGTVPTEKMAVIDQDPEMSRWAWISIVDGEVKGFNKPGPVLLAPGKHIIGFTLNWRAFGDPVPSNPSEVPGSDMGAFSILRRYVEIDAKAGRYYRVNLENPPTPEGTGDRFAAKVDIVDAKTGLGATTFKGNHYFPPNQSDSKEIYHDDEVRISPDTGSINSYLDHYALLMKDRSRMGAMFDSHMRLFPDVSDLPESRELETRTWEPPRLMKAESAVYPANLRSAGEEGVVKVAMLVAEDGRVDDARVISSTNRKFDEPASTSVRKWRFSPALLDGRPCKSVVIVPISFRAP